MFEVQHARNEQRRLNSSLPIYAARSKQEDKPGVVIAILIFSKYGCPKLRKLNVLNLTVLELQIMQGYCYNGMRPRAIMEPIRLLHVCGTGWKRKMRNKPCMSSYTATHAVGRHEINTYRDDTILKYLCKYNKDRTEILWGWPQPEPMRQYAFRNRVLPWLRSAEGAAVLFGLRATLAAWS